MWEGRKDAGAGVGTGVGEGVGDERGVGAKEGVRAGVGIGAVGCGERWCDIGVGRAERCGSRCRHWVWGKVREMSEGGCGRRRESRCGNWCCRVWGKMVWGKVVWRM